MSGLEIQYHLQKFTLLGVCFLGAALVGLLLAGAPALLVLTIFGVVWLFTLPYHAAAALVLTVATINSAFIIPAAPGRPFVWELGAVLGWSGLLMTLALRRQSPGVATRFRDNWMVYFGTAAYAMILIFLIKYHGIGIRSFGGGSGAGAQMGGRIYLQQLVCAVLPFLLLLRPLGEETLVRLYKWQCLLTVSFVIADFVFTFGGTRLLDILLFLELPTDGVNFEIIDRRFGIRRFQSLFIFVLGMLCLIWLYRPLRDYTNRNAIWMVPLTLALLAVGALSGHRHLLYFATVVLLINGWAQRFFTFQRLGLLLAVGCLGYFLAFAFVRDLPLAAQRALSALPGIEVDRLAAEDGRATLDGRRQIQEAGLKESAKYRIIGRGFGKPVDQDPSRFQFDMTYYYLDTGVFFNGTVGLLVNTGLPGTTAMFILLFGGSMAAWRVLRQVRLRGAEDNFLRLCSLLASSWFAVVISFVFLHGDSEFALRTFGLPAGLLVACDWHLRRRQESVPQVVPERITPSPVTRPVLAA